MVLMIASDLHGSAYYTKELLDAFHREGADRLLLLGDLLDGENLPPAQGVADVAGQLNAVKDRVIAVRGNCDDEADQALLEFPILAELVPLAVNSLRLYATHGHVWNETFPPAMEKGSILLTGHFHIPACVPHEDFLYLNPGSVAVPRCGSPRSYMVLRERTFTWKELDGTAYQSYTAE